MDTSASTVSSLHAVIEQRIPEYQYEQGKVYVKCTMGAVDMPVRDNMTYAEQLQNVHFFTFFPLPVTQDASSSEGRDRGQEGSFDLCCICLGTYSRTIPTMFCLDFYDHIRSKPCIEAWPNSTSANSILSPHCCTHICRCENRGIEGNETNHLKCNQHSDPSF